MSSARPAYLQVELVNPSKLELVETPTLHGLDEEFGENTVAQVGDRKTRTLIAVALGACIIGGLALASSTVHEGLRLKFGSAATSSRNTERDGSRQLVDGLLLQVEALKDEIRSSQRPPRLRPSLASRPIRNPATVYRLYTGTRTRLRCRSDSKVSRIRGAPCRFHDGQQKRVLHCVRFSRTHAEPTHYHSPGPVPSALPRLGKNRKHRPATSRSTEGSAGISPTGKPRAEISVSSKQRTRSATQIEKVLADGRARLGTRSPQYAQ